MKNVLVTGGTGFLGSNICKYLTQAGYKVTVFDNNFRGKIRRLESIKKNIVFVNGDIQKKEDLKRAIKNIDTVIHLAYINGTRFFYEMPINVLNVGIKGIFNILEICKDYRIKNFFLASSSEVYQTPNKIPTGEDEMLKVPDVYNPRYSYGGGKIISEMLSLYYGKKFFKKLIIFRPHNVYSEDMGEEHVIPQLINKTLKNKHKNFIKIKGEGKEIRSFIHINDFMQAFDLIFRKGKHLEIYNIGTTEKISIKELAMKVIKKINKKIKIKTGEVFKGNTNIRCPDISKIKKLGFKQNVILEKGLDLIINNLKIELSLKKLS
jgi:nucleoside-diphosphate-sugar epimerase